jgi:hypothetical protein
VPDLTHISLLKPLATVLKADRLGLGRHTARAPKKGVTHAQTALVAHVYAGNTLRKQHTAAHGQV